MPRVLVVDDEALCVMLLTSALEEEGFEVKGASSGEEAIKIGESFSPELLITDWKLGTSCDGLKVARTLRDADKDLEVIMISGLAAEEIRQQAMDLSIHAVLEKPCGLKEAMLAVRQVFEKRKNPGKPAGTETPPLPGDYIYSK